LACRQSELHSKKAYDEGNGGVRSERDKTDGFWFAEAELAM
jgi:hypothetical protein